MIKIYGSEMCPDCVACKKSFDMYGIPYEYTDINMSLRNLKEFLDYRDHLAVFDHCKEIGDIGLPALVEDDNVFLDWEGYLKKQGLEPLPIEGQTCSIDGKGC